MGVMPLENPASLISPISEERKYIRNSLLPSVLEVVAYNQAHKLKDFSIFEMTNLNTLTQTQERLAIVLSGQYVQSLWQKQVLNYDFYAIKGMLESLFYDLGIQNNRLSFIADENHSLFHPKRCTQVLIDKKLIGYCGEIHPSQSKSLGISNVIMAELNLSALFDLKKAKVKFVPINKYPSVTRDYAFVLDKSIQAEALEAQLRQAAKNMVVSIDIFDVYEGERISSNQKSIALKVVYQAPDHTLTEQEISEFYQRSIDLCTQNLKAQLRS
jgi:phenylalanyl-tRNA synthetase beta chain